MRKRLTIAILALLIAGSASAINRNDLIACLLGQAPEGTVCPVE